MTAKNDDIELVEGSGNVFRDLGLANADKEHLRAQLAAEIIGIVRRRKLTQREAAKLTGLTQAEVSHIKNAKLTGFTIDRMVTVLGKLDRQVKMQIVRPRRKRSVESA
jgi:predicted XRE-type DNA-binding protein